MNHTHWQLQTPISAVIFDCDGTLSSIEGIDELARQNDVYAQVQALTAAAMGSTGINPALYQQRLDLVRPTSAQVMALGEQYFAQQTPAAQQIIQILQRLNKTVYLMSAGLYPAVALFGRSLNIPAENIFAVNIFFDAQGNFTDYDQASPLVHNDGKRQIVMQLTNRHPTMAYIGDGLNDLSAYDVVTRFIGYGGTYYRANIADKCEYYIKSLSMAPLLPLILTATEQQTLTAEEQTLYQQGLHLCNLAT
jgi:phosphoserine phosphatase